MIWLNRPRCDRIDERRKVGDGIERNLAVFDGLTRWDRYSDGRVETSECAAWSEMAPADESLDIVIDRHFNPEQIRSILEFLTIEPIGRVRTADRNCVCVRALPRGDGPWPHWLPYRADEYELHVDLTRGVLLNIIGRHKGDLLGQHEVIEVAFDEPLNHNLFTYEPGPCERVQPKAPLYEKLSPEEAVSRMTFQVLCPTSMHESDYRLANIHFSRPHWPGGQSHLSLSYVSIDGLLSVWVGEGAERDPGLDGYDWEHLTYEGSAQKDIRISDSGNPEDQRIVAFEQGGTHVEVYSDLDRTKLIEIALSFQAAKDIQTGWPDDGQGGSLRDPF